MVINKAYILIDGDYFRRQADTIEELEIHVTEIVEMDNAEGFDDEQYSDYRILTQDDLKRATFAVYRQRKGYINERGCLINSKDTTLTYEQFKKCISGEIESDLTIYVMPYKGTGKRPEPRWTPELEDKVAQARDKQFAYICANPSILFDGDGDMEELF